MADFFLDANVDQALVPVLVGYGHNVFTTNEISRHDATDDEQFLLACDLGRSLITHDQQDYELLCHAWRSFSKRWGIDPGPHAGIIVLPQRAVLPYSRAASEIQTLLHSQEDIRDHYCNYKMKWGWHIQRF